MRLGRGHRILKDLTGQVFGRLTVVKSVGYTWDNRTRWECICECGNTRRTRITLLTQGRVKSCGCMSPVKDLAGKKFGGWTVVARAENSASGKAQWHCRCDCGFRRVVQSTNLTSGTSSSCGCLFNRRAMGTGPKWQKPRGIPRYTAFRREVLERDGYACVLGGKACGARLEIHHLELWNAAPKLRYVVSNGVTLCRKHHCEFHAVMGKGLTSPCTQRDFELYRERWYPQSLPTKQQEAS